MQFHQWQVHCLGRPQPKPPVQVRIRVKATGKVLTAMSYGADWLVANGELYTRHTADYLGRVEDATT